MWRSMGILGNIRCGKKKGRGNQGTALRNVYVINFEMRCAWKNRNRNVVLDSAHSIHVYGILGIFTYFYLVDVYGKCR